MGITEEDIVKAQKDFSPSTGGVKQDYFGLLYLAERFGKQPRDLLGQVAFGGNDYGIDAFFVDYERKNLYLFQFKWSGNHFLFKESIQRLISAGMDRVFGNVAQDQRKNDMLLQLDAQLRENSSIIQRVLVEYVFNGDIEQADSSAVLEGLLEDLQQKRWLIDQYFGRKEIGFDTRFASNESKKLAKVSSSRKTQEFKLPIRKYLEQSFDGKTDMVVGFVPLYDIYQMRLQMGEKFFEKNIRAGLDPERPANRELRKAFEQILLKESAPPESFVFNHNGITLSAQRVVPDQANGTVAIVEPRLLNGAQTMTSLQKFLDGHRDHPALDGGKGKLSQLLVLAKVIQSPDPDFVTNVTICNNRQNPVDAVNLRACDSIQCAFQDKFRGQLRIDYERQEKAFDALTNEDREELGIVEGRAIRIRPFAQTLLALHGEVGKTSNLEYVFESHTQYTEAFKEGYLHVDAAKLLLLYKVHTRLSKVIREIQKKGPEKYWFVTKTRNLTWALLIQGLLNHDDLDRLVERFGHSMSTEADFTEVLTNLGTNRICYLLSDVTKNPQAVQDLDNGKYGFLRRKATFDDAMEHARKRFRWQKRGLL